MSPSTSFSESLEATARKLPPYVLMAILLLLKAVHVPFAPVGAIKAPLFLIGLYYWSIHRPGLFPPWVVFACGIVSDIIGGLPLGLNACVYLLIRWTISDQRRFLMGQSFIVVWIGFVIVCTAALLFQWFIFGAITGNWPALNQVVFSILLAGSLFPLISVLLSWTHRLLTAQSGALE